MSFSLATSRATLAPRAGARVVVAMARARARPIAATTAASWFPSAETWFPGAEAPTYLSGLPANYGFDPLGLAKDNTERLKEGEVINGRWAMLAALGCLVAELTGHGSWAEVPFLTGGTFDVSTLLLCIAGMFAIGNLEILRSAEEDADKRLYPGGIFDPLNLASNKSEEEINKLRTQEIIHGRLAKLGCLGFWVQAYTTGESPLTNLSKHLADASNNNILTHP
jgi:hypothetical protein